MDVKVQWHISDNVESLVETVVECKKQLAKSAKQKYDKAKLLTCDAYVGNKALELFRLSELWAPCLELAEDDLVTPVWRREKKSTELVADFTVFKLHRMPVLGDCSVRLVVSFEVAESSAPQIMFGNVELLANV